MKRVIVFFVVLTVGLSVLLYWKLREQRLEAARPSGGSATVEGTEVAVAARIGARIIAIHVDEGDAVEAEQVLVELDCTELDAALAQADAGVAGARVGVDAALVGEAVAKRGVTAAEQRIGAATAGVKAAQAQRRATDVQRAAARRAARRVEKVGAKGAATEQTLDQARSQARGLSEQVRALAANVDAASANVGVAEEGRDTAKEQVRLAQVKVEAARKQLAAAQAVRQRAAALVAECRVVAPRAAIVQSRNFEPGEVALPGTRILTLIDAHEVKATFYLPNAELGAAKPGTSVEIVADAFPDRTFTGTVRRVATAAEFTPRNVQTREDRDRLVYAVEARIPNADGALRPGMPVEVRIPGSGASPEGDRTGAGASGNARAEEDAE